MEFKNKAVFFDRDGVININKHYGYEVSEFEFVDGIFQIMDYFQKDYLIIIVTNQSGIARGYFTHDDLNKLHLWMKNIFKEKGIKIQEIYYCPHHPEFNEDCFCRKPKPGMILSAIEKYNININDSILIGDSNSDIKAGENAGISKLIKVKPNDLSLVKKYIKDEN